MPTKTELKNAWAAQHTDRIALSIPKGEKDRIRSAAESAGESMCSYILNAVHKRMESENK